MGLLLVGYEVLVLRGCSTWGIELVYGKVGMIGFCRELGCALAHAIRSAKLGIPVKWGCASFAAPEPPGLFAVLP